MKKTRQFELNKKNKVRGSSQFTVTWSTVDVRESLSRYATRNMLFRAL